MSDRRPGGSEALKPPTSRVGAISLLLALGVHVGIVVWLAVRTPDIAAGGPPNVEGAGAGTVGGAPGATQRALHTFIVRELDEGHNVAGARVTDVLGNETVVTTTDGVATLSPHVAAALLLQVEKPGYALHSERIANSDGESSVRTVMLRRADVPYFRIDTIFIQRCQYCHGGPGSAGSIDLTSYDGLMKSRASDALIVTPGKPDSSILIRALTDSVGPRGNGAGTHIKRVGRFPEWDVEYIAEWIREGAKRP